MTDAWGDTEPGTAGSPAPGRRACHPGSGRAQCAYRRTAVKVASCPAVFAKLDVTTRTAAIVKAQERLQRNQ
ncbi:hypothetical protein MVI01_46790 [Myxococcus virescens]|uniref:Uncharacterized protein n=1 Tax=Myxococcus virescens TaxID=83456 RepID=A0A511HHE0_9BACT|nr:hypothetical protein MVI01_46790 [Myxococcus virescens]